MSSKTGAVNYLIYFYIMQKQQRKIERERYIARDIKAYKMKNSKAKLPTGKWKMHVFVVVGLVVGGLCENVQN